MVDEPAISLAVAALYSRFLEAFHRRSPSEMTTCVQVPLTVISGGRSRVISTESDADSMFAAMLSGLEDRGFGHTVMDRVEVTALDQSVALASVGGTRFDRRGGVLEAVRAVYTVVKADESWRIAVMITLAAA
jgi:hypothetical protein